MYVKAQPLVHVPASEKVDKLYSVSTLAQWSGECEAVWRKRIWRGELRAIHFGSNIRITENDLAAWMASRSTRKSS